EQPRPARRRPAGPPPHRSTPRRRQHHGLDRHRLFHRDHRGGCPRRARPPHRGDQRLPARPPHRPRQLDHPLLRPPPKDLLPLPHARAVRRPLLQGLRAPLILVIANNDLELLALRAAIEELPDDFPAVRGHGGVDLASDSPPPPLEGVRAVLVRLHKGRSAWREPFDQLRETCLRDGIALLAFGGEAELDAELAGLSTVPSGMVTEAATYWSAGGPANLAQLLRFVADTALLEGFGFEPPAEIPLTGRIGNRREDP